MYVIIYVYIAGLIASSIVSYISTRPGEVSFINAAIFHLLWPLMFPMIIVWALAADPTREEE